METIFENIRRKKKRLLAEQNFEINSKCDRDPATTSEDRIVGDQRGGRGRAFVYGKYPARRNACEAIAVHNAKVKLGVPSTLSETIAAFQSLRAMIFRGFFGSNVFKIGRVLKYYGIPYTRFFRKKRLAGEGLYIISYWNKRPWRNGIHTVTTEHSGAGFSTYNLRGDGIVSGEDPRVFGKRFITGYRLLADGGETKIQETE